MVKRGTFTSIWDNGTITTPATLDTETGEISTNAVDAPDDLGTLDEEWFEDEEGEQYDICPECHEYIIHTCMEPDEHISHQLNEVKRCKDPNCDYERYV
jgi:hypothetical protein